MSKFYSILFIKQTHVWGQINYRFYIWYSFQSLSAPKANIARVCKVIQMVKIQWKICLKICKPYVLTVCGGILLIIQILDIYTVKILYNDFIILQYCFRFLSGIWYYLRFIAIYIGSPCGATLSTRATTKHELWLDQLLVFIAVLDRVVNKTRAYWQLILFSDTVLISVMFASVLQPNTTLYLSKRWGSIRGVLIHRKRRVCNQYTRQDCPMGITEHIAVF